MSPSANVAICCTWELIGVDVSRDTSDAVKIEATPIVAAGAATTSADPFLNSRDIILQLVSLAWWYWREWQ